MFEYFPDQIENEYFCLNKYPLPLYFPEHPRRLHFAKQNICRENKSLNISQIPLQSLADQFPRKDEIPVHIELLFQILENKPDS